MIREIYKEGNAASCNLNPRLRPVTCNCGLALLLVHFVGLVKESRLKHALVFLTWHSCIHQAAPSGLRVISHYGTFPLSKAKSSVDN